MNNMNILAKSTLEKQVRKSPKLGRPPFQHQDIIPIINYLFPDIKTKRGQQNKAYELRALQSLKKIKPELNANTINNYYGKGLFAPTVLTELGRLLDVDPDIQEMVDFLSEDKWTTKGMVTFIRGARTLGNHFLN